MSKLNLKQASLLDASGELSRPARRELLAKISGDPAANQHFIATHENFSLLQSLPIPEPSAADRQFIPALIKSALHRALLQHEKQAHPAKRPQTLIRYAAMGLALAACVAFVISLVVAQVSQNARQKDQVARINALIDRVTTLSGTGADQPASPYEQAVTEVAASIRQLQTESPTLADLHDKDMANLLNALAAVPMGTDADDAADFSAPPGSF